MCGLTGFLSPSGICAVFAQEALAAMAGRLMHRGPDDGGTWVDESAGIALGHRRLSILDLSPAGHQPMTSASGRYVIAFNGEIYNHLSIRKELEASEPNSNFRGHSDTETLLAGVDCWGLDSVLRKTVGMFAFALWDRRERRLTLARDRMGEKPLYYGWQGDTLLFGSELKALRAHPAFRPSIDRDVLTSYLRDGYIAAPYSIYQDIFKVLPGTYVQFSARSSSGTVPKPYKYWSLREAAEHGLANPFGGSDADAVVELEARLMRAVSLQSMADVPLGAFLSGGIDSTTVVALMQAQSSHPVKTFTIGFQESSYNEAECAKAVARQLGTDHAELYVSARDAMDVIPTLPTLYDEPLGDSSAIPTFLVSQLARRHVTVSLSGDGGDELFGGYTRYRRTNDIWSVLRRIPYGARNSLSKGILTFSKGRGASRIARNANRLARYLSAESAEACYRNQMSQRHDARDLVVGCGAIPDAHPASDARLSDGSLYETMMYADAMTYLPDDILAKVDRASMGVSLEARVPMLDHRVVEFAWHLPMHMKVRKREGKWLLKRVLERYIPRAMIERPKMGFGVPVGQWLRGPLRDWAENLLSEDRLRREGLLNPIIVREQWSQHVAGSYAGDDSLWSVLMFQAWLSSATRLQ